MVLIIIPIEGVVDVNSGGYAKSYLLQSIQLSWLIVRGGKLITPDGIKEVVPTSIETI